jgi:hypothetical protein
VHCLIVHDDGSGPALFAGGAFTSAGGAAASAIARWNGTNWTPLAGGMGGSFTPDVYALAVYDDGAGPALHAGGDFLNANGVPAKHVARWNGVGWSGLGTGTNGNVYALAAFDAGEGSELHAAGDFGNAGGVAGVGRIARWNGLRWAKLAEAGMQADIFALIAFDDGSGPSLVAGGTFTAASGVAANRVARWDGVSWSPLASGVGVVPGSAVRALIVAAETDRETLHVGGEFAGTDFGDSFLATWPGCVDSRPPEVVCPAQVRVLEALASPPGEVVHFDVEATDNFDPTPLVVCVPPSGSFFPSGTSLVTCTATDDSGNQSTCQFTVHVDHKVRAR